jgi:hypothetical protein
VRLAEVDSKDLRELITEAWRCMAPKPTPTTRKSATKSTTLKKRTER